MTSFQNQKWRGVYRNAAEMLEIVDPLKRPLVDVMLNACFTNQLNDDNNRSSKGRKEKLIVGELFTTIVTALMWKKFLLYTFFKRGNFISFVFSSLCFVEHFLAFWLLESNLRFFFKRARNPSYIPQFRLFISKI